MRPRIILAVITRHFFWVTTGLVVALLAFLSLFLYNNLYRAITDTEVIVTLRTQYGVESVNSSAYHALQAFIADKKNRPRTEWQSLHNPFAP